MKKGVSEQVMERIKRIEGMDVSYAAILRYTIECRSFRWLCRHWEVNNRTVSKILKEFGVDIRHGGEAVATQWKNNPERRLKAGENIARINHKLAQEGKHIRQGKTKENSELIRNVSEKLKTNSSFNRPDVKARALAKTLATRRAFPERMSALKKDMTKAKAIIAHLLDEHCIEFEFNVLFKPNYVADFYIPHLNLVIDCKTRGRFPLDYTRHEAFMNKSDRVVYCVNEWLYRGNLGNLNEYISNLKIFCGNPSSSSKETMIFGACGLRPFGENTDKFRIERFGVHSNYYTRLSASTNN